MRKFSVLLSTVICSATLLSACQKTPEPEVNTEAPAIAISDKPTGLVKTAGRQVEKNKDVGQYLDQFSTKTAADIAKEEKLAKEAKEAKLALETKLASEAKAKESKTASNAKPLAVAPVVLNKAPELAASTVVPAQAIKVAPLAPAAAAATPTATPAAAEVTPLKLLSSVQPGFPRNAIRANVTEGVVSARIHISTDGKVTQVEILKAKPAKHFDQEVISAALQWKYAPISSPQTKLLEFAFNREN